MVAEPRPTDEQLPMSQFQAIVNPTLVVGRDDVVNDPPAWSAALSSASRARTNAAPPNGCPPTIWIIIVLRASM